jgi:hypothetical protein
MRLCTFQSRKQQASSQERGSKPKLWVGKRPTLEILDFTFRCFRCWFVVIPAGLLAAGARVQLCVGWVLIFFSRPENGRDQPLRAGNNVGQRGLRGLPVYRNRLLSLSFAEQMNLEEFIRSWAQGSDWFVALDSRG